MVQVYESQNRLMLSCFMFINARSGSSQRLKTKRQDGIGAIFATPGNISLAGQQNPTCGTTAFSDTIHDTGNIHEINALCRAWAFGTAAANRSRVVESPHVLTSIQFSLSLL
jgi:hypothetical protein